MTKMTRILTCEQHSGKGFLTDTFCHNAHSTCTRAWPGTFATPSICRDLDLVILEFTTNVSCQIARFLKNLFWQFDAIVCEAQHGTSGAGFLLQILPSNTVQSDWILDCAAGHNPVTHPQGSQYTCPILNGQEYFHGSCVPPQTAVHTIHEQPQPTTMPTTPTLPPTMPTTQEAQYHTDHAQSQPTTMPTTSTLLPTVPTTPDAQYPLPVTSTFQAHHTAMDAPSLIHLLRHLNTLNNNEQDFTRTLLAHLGCITTQGDKDKFLALHRQLGHCSIRDTLAVARYLSIPVGNMWL